MKLFSMIFLCVHNEALKAIESIKMLYTG